MVAQKIDTPEIESHLSDVYSALASNESVKLTDVVAIDGKEAGGSDGDSTGAGHRRRKSRSRLPVHCSSHLIFHMLVKMLNTLLLFSKILDPSSNSSSTSSLMT